MSVLYRAVWSSGAPAGSGRAVDELRTRVAAWTQETDDPAPLVEGRSEFDVSQGRHREVVQYIAGMMESVHQDMGRFFELTDDIKTDVIMTDHIDSFDRFNLEVVRKPGEYVSLFLGDMTAGAPSFDIQTKDW